MLTNDLQKLMAKRIASGLKRKTITSCSKWAQAYRIMGAPFPGHYSFDHHPWCKEMHDCDADDMVGQKAAQMGYTEVALNKALYHLDVLRNNVLYILPASHPDASDFSTSRFDPAVELSPHLQKLFSDVKNIGHKRAGAANLFIRGSRSRSQLKSIPVALAIADELEEMDQSNVALIPERMSGQREKQFFKLSTPSIRNKGINAHYRRSSQNHYFFRCPHCSRLTELVFPDCLVITAEDPNDDKNIINSYLKCKECDHALSHDTKPEWLNLNNAQWVPSFTDRLSIGFQISQMYSFVVKPWELAKLYLIGQSDPSSEQEFYNSKLGLTHEVEGARITDENIDSCIGGHTQFDKSPAYSLITMGVDVGTWLHYEICEWKFNPEISSADLNINSKCRVIKYGKVAQFEELDQLVRQFNVIYTIVDANPERRKAIEFAQRFYGTVKLCLYGLGTSNRQVTINGQSNDEVAIEEYTISVDRTSWMDMALGRFKSGKITLPKDLNQEYREHLKTPVRVYVKDRLGNPVGKYEKGENEEDHYAHARTYCEIALQFAASLARNQDLSGVY